MTEQASPWWIVAAAAFVPGLISGYQLWRASRDKDKDRDLTERLGVSVRVDAQTKVILERLDAEIQGLRKRLDETEEEKREAEEKVWVWLTYAYEMRQHALSARSLIATTDRPESWKDLILPPFEAEKRK